MEVPQLHVVLEVDLVQQLLLDEELLLLQSLVLLVEHLVGFFGAEVRLVVEFLNVVGVRLSVTVALDLLGEETEVVQIILLPELRLMHSNHILLLLLPIKLLPLILPGILDLLTFFLEALVRHVVNFLDVVHILLAFVLGVVVYFEGTLGPHEVGVGLGVVVG